MASGITVREIERARCPEGVRHVKLRDAQVRGLYLRVTERAKSWYCRLRRNGADTDKWLGEWPTIDIKEARRLAAIKQGEKPEPVAKDSNAKAHTFGAALDTHLDTHRANWRGSTKQRQTWLAECLEPLRDRPLFEITPKELADFLNDFATKDGHVEKAHRLRSLIAAVYDDAIVREDCATNPAARIGKLLPKRSAKSFAAITDRRRFGELLLACDNYYTRGDPNHSPAGFVRAEREGKSNEDKSRRMSASTMMVGFLLRLLPLVGARQGEVRHMRWSHLDLKNPAGPIWNVPASDVKTDVALCIPLSRQAVEIIEELKLYRATEEDAYVFEGRAGSDVPLSENAVNVALQTLGFGGEHVGHGFRTSFSTLANEQGWNRDAIEIAIGHRIPGVRGTYMRSALLEPRRKLMQDWADLCDQMKAAAIQ